MKNKFMLILKNPPTTMIIDSIPDATGYEEEVMNLTQDGMQLIIPISSESNIAFIKEVTPEEIEEMEKQKKEILEQMKDQGGRIVTPKIPGRSN